jgi:NAD(P)-dependent dehydrogenase (short-subunit alcohol dehydrogenase family)
MVREEVMDLDIKDLRVLVTAGAGGIGLEIARALFKRGRKVHLRRRQGSACRRRQV